MKKGLIRREAVMFLPLLAALLAIVFYFLFQLKGDMRALTEYSYTAWSMEYERIPDAFAEVYLDSSANSSFSYAFDQVNGALFMRLMTAAAGKAAQGFSVLAFLTACLVFLKEKLPGGADFLYSLPVTKKRLFSVRLLCAAGSILIPWLVFSAGILRLQAAYRPWILMNAEVSNFSGEIAANESALHAAVFLGLMAVVILAVYAAACLMQVLCRNPAFAAGAGALWLLAPYYISAMLNHYLLRYAGKELRGYRTLQNLFRPEYLFREEPAIVWDSAGETMIYLQGISLPAAKFAIFGGLLAVCIFAAVRLYGKHGVLPFHSAGLFEKATVLLSGVYLGLATVRINEAAGLNAPSQIAVALAAAVITVFPISRLFRISWKSSAKKRERKETNYEKTE